MKIVELIIIVILLFLLTATIFMYRFDYGKMAKRSRFWPRSSSETTKAHLRVSREEIYQHPEKVNKLLADHNITNVRAITKDQLHGELKKYSYLLNRAKSFQHATKINFS